MKEAKLARIFKALSNEHRLYLFKLIYTAFKKEKSSPYKGEGRCCEDIEKAFTKACDRLNLSRSTISHHFKELQDVGLITCNRKGGVCVCHANPESVEAIRHYLE